MLHNKWKGIISRQAIMTVSAYFFGEYQTLFKLSWDIKRLYYTYILMVFLVLHTHFALSYTEYGNI